MAPKSVENVYLSGNFYPVAKEHEHEVVRILRGEIPSDLKDGMYVRNSAVPHETVESNTYHWFDGNGMLQGVYFRNGKVTYVNRHVETKRRAVERQFQTALPPFLGKIIGTAIPRVLQAALINNLLLLTSNPHISYFSNTSVVFHNRRLLSLAEAEGPLEVQLPNLKTVRHYNFANDDFLKGKGARAMTAHPKVCPNTGNMYFFGYDLAFKPHVTYSVASPEGQLHINKKPLNMCDRPVMMHDFAITQHWAIILDMPLLLDPMNLGKGKSAIAFNPSAGARIHLVDRETGGDKCTMTFHIDPCIVLHTAHAFESTETNEVVLIGCMAEATNFPSMDMRDPKTWTRLTEFRMNLISGETAVTRLGDDCVELPVICSSRFMDPGLRHIYAARVDTSSQAPLFDGIVKYDLANKTNDIFNYEAGYYGGEPCFVPKPNAKDQDDGFLLVFSAQNSSSPLAHARLLIIDAKTLKEVCVLEIPDRVPFGFHGTWVSKAKILSQDKRPAWEDMGHLSWKDWVLYKAICLIGSL